MNLNENERKNIFSVIIPIYNAEKYLAEAIDSVINQTIGFENNIHIILVNDGSHDRSGEICEKYVSMYPDNIEYIYQENKGVAVARNTGLDRVKGKYVNMLDADDKWTLDAFEKAYAYFEIHYDEIDVLSCRVKQFGRTDEYHFLDFKYDRDRIVDILEDYHMVQMFTNSIFIKAEAVKDERVEVLSTISEDILFVNKLIFKRGRYASLRSIEYLYRKSKEMDSAIDRKFQKYDFYFKAPREVYGGIFALSREKYGEVIPYVQYLVANDGRVKLEYVKEKPAFINKENWKEFLGCMRSLFEEIDDEIIMKLRKVGIIEKAKILQFKNGCDFDRELIVKKFALHIDIMDVEKKGLVIEGRSNMGLLDDNYSLVVEDKDGKTFKPAIQNNPVYDVLDVDGKVLFNGKTFRVVLPISKGNRFRFAVVNKKEGIKKTAIIKMERFSRVSSVDESFFCENKKIIYKNKNEIIVRRASKKRIREKEQALNKAICDEGLYDIVRLREESRKLAKGKPIILLQDRGDKASDNAEAFFKYIVNTKYAKKFRIYFAVSKNSEDFIRLSRYGKVVDYNSEEYKAIFLAAKYFISSQWTWESEVNPTLNPFRKERKYVQDLIGSKFVFLQHGITINNLSAFGHKLKRNVKLFIAAAKEEYKSILYGNYGYSEQEVVLSGLARFDYLEDNLRKDIIFMPTWRKQMDTLSADAVRKTHYVEFFNKLISDSRIVSVMKKNGYSGRFIIHPAMGPWGIDKYIHGNELVSVENNNVNFTELFSEGALLVTDYSSTAMDFAYLKKPVVYTQADRDTFFSNHTYTEGYFDYSKDGFGPVCSDYEETVESIVQYIEKDCEMEEKYKKRVDEFFMYTDKNNCERIWRAIRQI